MTAMNTGQGWLLPEMAFPGKPGAYENECYTRGFRHIAGLDEAGRGTWAGPVVAAAVIFPKELLEPDSELQVDSKLETPNSNLEIKDSKLLTAKKRESLSSWIKDKAAAWGVGIVGSQEIDRINILNASLLAMSQALGQLDPVPDCILIDGSHKIPAELVGKIQKVKDVQKDSNDLKRLEPMLRQRTIEKGDRLCLSISAASILAKVERDRIMQEYDQLYPEYGFALHKGYGSPSHLAALERCGPSPIHRMSFKPVRDWLDRAAGDQPSIFPSRSAPLFGRE